MFDLSMETFEAGDILIYNLRYSTDLFMVDTMRCFAKNYEKILREIVKNPSKKIKDIKLVNKTDLSKKRSGYLVEGTA
jgi:hypothetical protein